MFISLLVIQIALLRRPSLKNASVLVKNIIYTTKCPINIAHNINFKPEIKQKSLKIFKFKLKKSMYISIFYNCYL